MYLFLLCRLFHCRRVVCACSADAVGSFLNINHFRQKVRISVVGLSQRVTTHLCDTSRGASAHWDMGTWRSQKLRECLSLSTQDPGVRRRRPPRGGSLARWRGSRSNYNTHPSHTHPSMGTRLWAVPCIGRRRVCVSRDHSTRVWSRAARVARVAVGARAEAPSRGAGGRRARTPRSTPGAERGHIRYSLRFRAFISFPSRPPHRSRHLGRRPRRFRDALRSASWHRIFACTSGRPPLFHNF